MPAGMDLIIVYTSVKVMYIANIMKDMERIKDCESISKILFSMQRDINC